MREEPEIGIGDTIILPYRRISRITKREDRAYYAILLPYRLNEIWEQLREKKQNVTVIIKLPRLPKKK